MRALGSGHSRGRGSLLSGEAAGHGGEGGVVLGCGARLTCQAAVSPWPGHTLLTSDSLNGGRDFCLSPYSIHPFSPGKRGSIRPHGHQIKAIFSCS